MLAQRGLLCHPFEVPNLSLRLKLLLLLTGITVTPLMLVGYSLLASSSDEIKRRVNDELLQSADRFARLIDQTYNDSWMAPLTLARDSLDGADDGAQEGPARLNGISNLPDIAAVEVVDASGISTMRAAARTSERFHATPSEIDTLLRVPWSLVQRSIEAGNVYVGEAQYNARWDFWSLVVALPLKHADVPTALVARISLDRLRQRLRDNAPSASGAIALVDARGIQLLEGAAARPGSIAMFRDVRAAIRTGHQRLQVKPYTGFAGESMLAAYAPVKTLSWTVLTERSEASAFGRIRQMLDSLGLWLAAGLGAALIGARLVSSRISQPILDIAEATAEISAGNFNVRIPNVDNRHDEIGVLSQQINAMVAGLSERERIKDIFGRYQTVEVMQTLLGSPDKLALGGEMRNVTIMMTDLRGFTAAAGRLPPQEVLGMLNNYFEVMVAICTQHKGTIIEILGDALLVLFGAPIALPDHAARAVTCAIEMQNAMQKVNDTNSRAGLPQLEMGIGLNTGDVVVGNIGSYQRAKYGVVGTHVNLASRIESYTVGGQVLVSRSVCDAAGPIVRISGHRSVEAKGLSEPLTICEIAGIDGDYKQELKPHHDAMHSLTTAVSVALSIIDGKDVRSVECQAKLTKLSARRAILEADYKLSAYTNLRMVCKSADLAGHDIYAKVVEPAEGGPQAYIIHFTSVPKEVQGFFANLMGLRPVAHFMPPPVKPKPIVMTRISPAKEGA